MSRVILTTVGVSLADNARRAGRAPAELLRSDPKAACAEANVLSRLLAPGDTVDLFHSQTEDGTRCAEALHDWLGQQGRSARLVPVEGLTHRAEDFHRGLRSLVRQLAQHLRDARRRGDEPVLNALGGFKSEVIYATLVGTLFRVPNVYMHQGFDTLQTIPPLPVSWDFAAIDAHSAILAWIDEAPRTHAEARSRLLALPTELRESLIADEDDGFTYLSPLGEACYEAYRARVETAADTVLLSSGAAKAYAAAEPQVRAAFDRILARLRVPEIRRQGSKTMARDSGDVLVFPQGHVNERVLWHETDDAIVRILEITRHGPDYDRLYRAGVRRIDYAAGDWHPWQAPSESPA